MVERATRWENLVSLYILVEQSFHVSSGISTSGLLSEKEKQIYLHIVHITVIRVSIFCKTYILTVIEFDTCIEVASIINPKIPDDQKIQISKSEFQISESGKAINVLFFKQVFTCQPMFRKQFPERCSNREKCRESSKWWCAMITSHFQQSSIKERYRLILSASGDGEEKKSGKKREVLVAYGLQ